MSKRKSSTNKIAGDVLKSLLVVSRAVDQVLENSAVNAVTNGGLAVSRMRIVMFLGHRGEQTPTRVAKFLGVSKPAVTQIIDAMIRSGFVNRRAGLDDRREVELDLTMKGRRTFSAIRRKQTQVVRVALELAKHSSKGEWVSILHEITRSLLAADQTYEKFCLQCGAHADGTCVLLGGQACCLLRKKQSATPRPRRQKARRVTA